MLLLVVVVEQAAALVALVSCPSCEIPGRSGFAFHQLTQHQVFEGLDAIRHGSGSWVAGWWIRGQTVGTVVRGRRPFEVLRPYPKPLAGNVYEVEQLLLLMVSVR